VRVPTDHGEAARARRALGALAFVQLLSMAPWFSASAVVPQLALEWQLGSGAKAWLTMAVQLGFVCGALTSALFNLPDRVPPQRLIAGCAMSAALFTAALTLPGVGPVSAIVLRFATGAALAGVYPPGMRVAASWTRMRRGLAIGLLVGAITAGSALPHLFNALPLLGADGMPPWRPVLLTVAGIAGVGALLTLTWVRTGPLLAASAPFDWRQAWRPFTERGTRLANFGYLGHMWELYAMWTWVPLFLLESYERAGLERSHARLAGFGAIAIGSLGSLLAGLLADRLGRTRVAGGALVLSGSCALFAGACLDSPMLATALCLVWGFAVVADSAQFSAAVSELSDPRYVGTALTVQTCSGYLLTLISIQIVPPLVERLSWGQVFPLLALGPVCGTLAMLRLRSLPEAVRMAGGRR